MSEIPRVMRVEYCQRDKIWGGEWREWTEADVMTPMGEIHVSMPGYHAEKPQYPALMDFAMDKAWLLFCTAGFQHLSAEWNYISEALNE